MREELILICILLVLQGASSFAPSFQTKSIRQTSPAPLYVAANNNHEANSKQKSVPRRSFMLGAGLLSTQLLPFKFVVWADDDATDLTSTLFNPDGSPKGEIEEAKTRTVEIAWTDEKESRDKYAINVDGKDSPSTKSGSEVRLSYKIPEKWQQLDDGYFDKSTPNKDKACEKITVYRAPGDISPERLAKATTIGLAEALCVTDELSVLKRADLISGRTRKQGDVKFYDFDMAVAPRTCANSAENLGLGFCPFDSIYLLSAAVLQESLYVIVLECDKSEWKIANADLKRVRSSFAFDI